ncbi:hypothetical protein ACVBGC_32505 [Burkholderia stagnalis]
MLLLAGQRQTGRVDRLHLKAIASKTFCSGVAPSTVRVAFARLIFLWLTRQMPVPGRAGTAVSVASMIVPLASFISLAGSTGHCRARARQEVFLQHPDRHFANECPGLITRTGRAFQITASRHIYHFSIATFKL